MEAPYAEGPLDCKIAFVGEAPGEEEVARRRPFIGKAGRKFDKLLRPVKIDRSTCRIENVFQVRPPNNEIKHFINLNRDNIVPTEIFLEHQAALKERLEPCTANVIVALGNTAIYALCQGLGRPKVTARRGSILESDLLPGRKVIPTIHPSATLRQKYPQVQEHFVTFDLMRIVRESQFPDIRLLQRDLILEPTFPEALSYIRDCNSVPLVGFDIETSREEITHISLATSSSSAICIPFMDGGQDYWNPDQELEIWLHLAALLENPQVTKLAQNGAFDVGFIYKRLGIVTGPLDDTMIAQGILYPDYPKGLDFQVSTYCNGEPYYKDDRKKWTKNPFGSELIFRRYNAMDSAVLMEIFPRQLEELEKQGNLETYQRQKALIHPLVYMAERGIKVDREGLRKGSEDAAGRIDEARKRLDELTEGMLSNPNSHQQVAAYFYVLKGEKPYLHKGEITTNKTALQRLARKGYEEASLILEIRSGVKMKGTYYDITVDEDSRLRCFFNPVGTKTGRISSSETVTGTGGNLQNQPETMNALMQPDPGYIGVNLDLAQAENRYVAYVAGELTMIRAFEEGIDIHSQTGGLIYRVLVSEVTPKQRGDGKTSNHSFNFGQGYGQFSLRYQMPLNQAKWIWERYHKVYPGVRQWHSAVRDELSRNGRTLTNAYGRKRTFRGYWGDDMWREAYNWGPQGSIGEKMNQDGFRFIYERQDLFPEVELLSTVHDSVKFQVPLAVGALRVIQIIDLIKDQLERPMSWRGTEFKIPVDAALGFSFGEEDMLEWKHNHFEAAPWSDLVKELEDYVARA